MLAQGRIRNAFSAAWGATDALILARTGEEPESSPETAHGLRMLELSRVKHSCRLAPTSFAGSPPVPYPAFQEPQLRRAGVPLTNIHRDAGISGSSGTLEAFFGQILTMFAAWVADHELQSVKRRTKEGLERARDQGKVLGPPLKFQPEQVEVMRRMRDGGASLQRIAGDFEFSASTVLRALRREGVG